MVSGSVSNSGLFEKNLGKISTATIGRFGSVEAINSFLEEVANCGNIHRAADGSNISSLSVGRIINDDRYLSRCVAMAKQIAVEKCESVLYERAINGYEEITYGRDGETIQVKRKYCSKSLMEYLKANSDKYSVKAKSNDKASKAEAGNVGIGSIEVKSYASDEE